MDYNKLLVYCYISFHKCFLALARTRASKTELRIGECAVWKGFIMVWAVSKWRSREDDWGTHFVIQLPHVHEEGPDALFIFGIVEENELHIWERGE